MRHLYIVTLLACLFMLSAPSAARAQSMREVLNDVVTSVGRGAPDRLARYLNNRVIISIDGVRKEYTNTQARYVLTRFYQQRPFQNFQLIDQGQTNGMIYARIRYQSVRVDYLVTVFMRGARVTQLRFESR